MTAKVVDDALIRGNAHKLPGKGACLSKEVN